jgi:hypothetical protein
VAVAGSRIDVKRLIVLRPIKNKMETRPDDNKIHISALGAPMSLA